ncbi:MAG TPA: diguanylate cyclase, partial [Arenimonas sp.]|nr:diguanylate cyclase [Arenimonas sp.]
MNRSVSLRTFLTAPFLLVFLLAAAAFSWISYRNALAAVDDYGKQFAAEIGQRIHAHLQYFFDVPVRLVKFNREALLDGQLDAGQPQLLIHRFVSQMRHLPHLTFVSMGLADGQYVGASRAPDSNELQLMTALADEGMTMDTFAVLPGNRRGDLLAKGDAYDARRRPWFEMVAERPDGLYWYPVYRHRVYRSVGVGVAAPVRDNSGRLLGVLTGDLALDQLSRYLQGIRVGRAGVAFVVDGEGRLLGSSRPEPVFEIDGRDFRQLRAVEHPHPALRAAGRLLASQPVEGGRQRVEAAGERYLLDVRELRDGYGLDLRIVVLLPEREFSAVVEESARIALMLAIGAVLSGAGIGLLLTRWIAWPIERISARADRLAQGEMRPEAQAASPVREVNQLGQSFERMAAQLRELIEHLEERVVERTRDLQQARDELERLSTLDGLTQIYNRRRFDQVLGSEWQRATRDQRPLSLILCDVDHFKLYNDHFGHHAGDLVLIRVAACVADAARRPGDLPARFG